MAENQSNDRLSPKGIEQLLSVAAGIAAAASFRSGAQYVDRAMFWEWMAQASARQALSAAAPVARPTSTEEPDGQGGSLRPQQPSFLFVGNEDAGDNIAGLYSLVATCESHGKNPLAYLTDVLARVGSHPQSKIDELLPDRWQPSAR